MICMIFTSLVWCWAAEMYYLRYAVCSQCGVPSWIPMIVAPYYNVAQVAAPAVVALAFKEESLKRLS